MKTNTCPPSQAHHQHYLNWNVATQEEFKEALKKKPNLLKIMEEFLSLPKQDIKIGLQRPLDDDASLELRTTIKHPFELLTLLTTQDNLEKFYTIQALTEELLEKANSFRTEIIELKMKTYLRNMDKDSPEVLKQVVRRWSGSLTEIRSSVLPDPKNGPSGR